MTESGPQCAAPAPPRTLMLPEYSWCHLIETARVDDNHLLMTIEQSLHSPALSEGYAARSPPASPNALLGEFTSWNSSRRCAATPGRPPSGRLRSPSSAGARRPAPPDLRRRRTVIGSSGAARTEKYPAPALLSGRLAAKQRMAAGKVGPSRTSISASSAPSSSAWRNLGGRAIRTGGHNNYP